GGRSSKAERGRVIDRRARRKLGPPRSFGRTADGVNGGEAKDGEVGTQTHRLLRGSRRQRAAPSRPLSTWLTPASHRPAACPPSERVSHRRGRYKSLLSDSRGNAKSLHHVIDDAQRTERT